jgi:diguanylate cyclase (GGDEF)-like protein
MIDIDFFKRVNDTQGHAMGDAVLSSVARVLREQTRETDVVGRYGGEEMVVVAVETSVQDAVALAERIRAAIESHNIRHDGRDAQVTVSIGCAELSDSDCRADDLVARADSKMYEAKEAGRNRVAS